MFDSKELGFMNSKERVLTAVRHEETDRIPITFDAEKEVYKALYNHLGLDTKENYLTDSMWTRG